MPFEPTIETIEAEWAKAPDGPVRVRAFAYCGGPLVEELAWHDATQPFVFVRPRAARCLEFTFNQPAAAELVELRVTAPDRGITPRINHVSARALDGRMVHLDIFDPDRVARFVRLYYLPTFGAGLDEGVVIDEFVNRTWWEGPLPVHEERFAALVPIAEDGTEGLPHRIAFPTRSDTALHDGSGVVEGFYGRPWSWKERRALVRHLSSIGLGLYIYGPKDDPLHRDAWRTPYPEEVVARFLDLNRLAAELGVTFSLGISPGKDMDMGDGEERATLIAKLEPFANQTGRVRHFTLLLDDIEFGLDQPVDGALGAEHADLANWLRDALGDIAHADVTLDVVPTVYSTNRQEDWPGGNDYLDALADLHADIQVMWTGTRTFSPSLSAADLADVTARIGRAPVLWDNEHAIDGGDAFVGKVYAAPYAGRTPDLVDALAGIVANPMILGAANRLVLPSYARFLDDPETYDGNAARFAAAELEGSGATDEEIALYLAETFHGNGIEGIPAIGMPINPAMNSAVTALEEAVRNGDKDAVREASLALMIVAAEMATAQERLHHSGLDAEFVDDFWVPADRLTHEGRQLLHLLRWFTRRPTDLSSNVQLELSDRYRWLALGDRYQLSLFVVDALRAFLVARPPVFDDFSRPIVIEPDTELRAERKTVFEPVVGADVAIFGLPGASVDGPRIAWTPPHAGIYRPVVVAWTDSGWDFAYWTLTVEPAVHQPIEDNDEFVPGDLPEDPPIDEEFDSAGYCCGF
ncbi:MAG: protein O-GlcNAcase [Deltaproteobacteria bacterium]|nr:protein O-GlcNAcase [Deltaproteobacteria bacterium]